MGDLPLSEGPPPVPEVLLGAAILLSTGRTTPPGRCTKEVELTVRPAARGRAARRRESSATEGKS